MGGTGYRLFVGFIWNVPLYNLPEDNHRLTDKLAEFLTGDDVEMIFGVHQFDKQIDASLMQTHCCLLPPDRPHYPSTIRYRMQCERIGEATSVLINGGQRKTPPAEASGVDCWITLR
jgi:hypothetical protein